MNTYVIAILIEAESSASPKTILRDFVGAGCSMSDYRILEADIRNPGISRQLAEWKDKDRL